MPDAIRIDLNADLGEGFGAWQLGDDEALLDVVTSANVACGFHAGDPVIMRRVCAQAAERGVAVGAQVSYRDLAGFGRRRIEIAPDELSADVLYQLAALAGIAAVEGTAVSYVKPHGALYNTAMDDPKQADAVAAAVTAFDHGLPILGLPDSALADAAAARGLGYVVEAFADRGYLPSGRLVPRGEAGALITDPAAVAAQAVRIAHGTLVAVDASIRPVAARSLCVHSDTPGAVSLVHAVRQALEANAVQIARFA